MFLHPFSQVLDLETFCFIRFPMPKPSKNQYFFQCFRTHFPQSCTCNPFALWGFQYSNHQKNIGFSIFLQPFSPILLFYKILWWVGRNDPQIPELGLGILHQESEGRIPQLLKNHWFLSSWEIRPSDFWSEIWCSWQCSIPLCPGEFGQQMHHKMEKKTFLLTK